MTAESDEQVPALFSDPESARHILDDDGPPVFDHLIELWSRCYPYLDHGFASAFDLHVRAMRSHPQVSPQRNEALDRFQQRYWELYLCNDLIAHGERIEPRAAGSEEGPDFKVVKQGTFCWIECTVPSQGEGPDRVPDMHTSGVAYVPEDPIKLRYTSALLEKLRKHRKYLENGVLNEGEAYVVAINGSNVPYASTDRSCPRIVRCVFGLGRDAVTFNKTTDEFSEPFIKPQAGIPRDGRDPIPSTAFLNPIFSPISAIVYSLADPFNRWKAEEGQTQCFLVCNPLASVPISDDWFRWMPKYVCNPPQIGKLGRIDLVDPE